jgi:WhiB family transcriptional regulator, redox-sensing transcriptional regulator
MRDIDDVFSAVDAAKGWMHKANCKDMDTKLFFPEDGHNLDPFVVEVCNSCSVIEECLWYANETHADYGVFGGLSRNKRVMWRKKNKVELGMSMQDWENRRAS